MRRPSAYRLHKILIFISGLSLSVALTGYLSLTFSWFFFNRSGQTDAPRVKILAKLQVTYDIYLDDSVAPLVGDEIVFSDLIPAQVFEPGGRNAAPILSKLEPVTCWL